MEPCPTGERRKKNYNDKNKFKISQISKHRKIARAPERSMKGNDEDSKWTPKKKTEG